MKRSAPSSQTTLLIIEDEAFIRNVITLHFEQKQYRVITAENGQEGYAQLHAHHPDAIVCDILMPREDGIAFCRRIRGQGIRTPILFLSAKSQSDHVVEGLAAGADDYLVKPFNLEELSIRVGKLMSRREKK